MLEVYLEYSWNKAWCFWASSSTETPVITKKKMKRRLVNHSLDRSQTTLQCHKTNMSFPLPALMGVFLAMMLSAISL